MQTAATTSTPSDQMQPVLRHYVNRLKKHLLLQVRTWINIHPWPYDWMKWCVPHLLADMYVFPIYNQLASTYEDKRKVAMEMCWEAWQKGQDDRLRSIRDDSNYDSRDSNEERRYTDELHRGMGRMEGIDNPPDQGRAMKACPSPWSTVPQQEPLSAQASYWAVPAAPESAQPRHEQVEANRAELRSKLSTAARAWSFEQAMRDTNVAHNDLLYWCIPAVTSDLLQNPAYYHAPHEDLAALAQQICSDAWHSAQPHLKDVAQRLRLEADMGGRRYRAQTLHGLLRPRRARAHLALRAQVQGHVALKCDQLQQVLDDLERQAADRMQPGPPTGMTAWQLLAQDAHDPPQGLLQPHINNRMDMRRRKNKTTTPATLPS
eukprot:4927278-Pyramimonas_sp.AAC.1